MSMTVHCHCTRCHQTHKGSYDNYLCLMTIAIVCMMVVCMTAARMAAFVTQTEVPIVAAIVHAGIIHTVNIHTNNVSLYNRKICLTAITVCTSAVNADRLGLFQAIVMASFVLFSILPFFCFCLNLQRMYFS